MDQLPQLYKGIVKQLRVVRNIRRDCLAASGETEVHPSFMTPYERGRMQSSLKKLSWHLDQLCVEHHQMKVSYYFYAFLNGLDVSVSQFEKPGSGGWNYQYLNAKTLEQNRLVDPDAMPEMLAGVGRLLDTPLNEVPSNMVLLKLRMA